MGSPAIGLRLQLMVDMNRRQLRHIVRMQQKLTATLQQHMGVYPATKGNNPALGIGKGGNKGSKKMGGLKCV